MGKSTSLRRYRNGEAIEASASLFVDLAAYSSESRFERRLNEDEVVEAWTKGSHDLTLILDSFDEGYGRMPTLPNLLVEFLEANDTTRLRLRIACRTAAWPMSLSRRLKDCFAEVDAYELLPLRRQDAEALCPSSVPAELFLEAVERLHVAPLAARPLTHRLLARIFERDGNLPRRANDIYERGLNALCDESNDERRDAASREMPSPTTRLNSASRIAAYSIFGGLPTIWTGMAAEADAFDLTIDAIATHSGISISGVKDALATGIFTGAGAHRQTWSHATFADYLAARWLHHSLSDHQQHSILFAADGKLNVRMRSVAAWLVSLDPRRGPQFITPDPEAFLLNVDLPTDETRKLVVDALIDLARNGDLIRDYRRDLANVNHNNIAEQLQPALHDSNPEVRRLAVDLARACRVTALAADLASMALNSLEDDRIRVSAAIGMHELSPGNPRDDLAPLARALADSADTISRELLGAALLASWPHAMPTNDVLANLSARGPRNTIDLFTNFVADLANALTPNDLQSACQWLRDHALNNDDDPRISTLIHSAFRLAIGNLNTPYALRTIQMIVQARATRYADLFPELKDSPSFLDTYERRRLLTSLFIDADDDLVLAIADPTNFQDYKLLRNSDFDWLVSCCAAESGTLQRNYAQALRLLFSLEDRNHIDTTLELPATHPAAEALAYWRGTCDLTSPEIIERRAFYNRLKQRKERRENDPNPAMNEEIGMLAQRAALGDTIAYQRATELITIRPGTNAYMDTSQPDLTAHPRWDTLTSSVKSDLVAASRAYLETASPGDDVEVALLTSQAPLRAGFRAAILLLRLAPNILSMISAAAWPRWAPIIVAWTAAINGARSEDKKVLIAMAKPHARERLIKTALALVDHAIYEQEHTFLEVEFAGLWDEDLANGLFDCLSNPSMHTNTRGGILDAFAAKDPTRVRALLVSWLNVDGRSRNPDRARDAAARLLWNDASASWQSISELMHDDPEFVAEVMLQAAHQYDRHTPDLASDELAHLYIFLARRFPHSDDPRFEGAHVVSQRESLATWRDSIVSSLSQRGTDSSVAAIDFIVRELPELTWLHYYALQARLSRRSKSWTPTPCADLERLALDHRASAVTTEAALCAVVLRALVSIQERLQGDTPSAPLLWDTHARRPKPEDQVSDYLRTELQNHLSGHGGVVNREVQVRTRPGASLGERTDIRIDAMPTVAGGAYEHLTVVAEVKGCWNTEIVSSIKSQLVDRYMEDLYSRHGVYIALWFDPADWTDTDTRRRQAAKFDSAQSMHAILQAEAEAVKPHDGQVSVVILDASLTRPRTAP
ncbi:hypothetical protein HQ602_16620 [Rhodococcus kroppenstedtii]|uniref:NACHT domain-containing protein n=1 Tax=Rhodococcoides kroppenstedtii TaxID=293050 RepID=UPI001C9B2D21|nr:hypothetical protein [Rhodococcus kroppenstedtii]MBY6438005.1 hypothetical protein [Rhodococcus kroppenstedtii]